MSEKFEKFINDKFNKWNPADKTCGRISCATVWMRVTWDHQQKKIDELEAKNKKLVECVKFYADIKNWKEDPENDDSIFNAWINDDEDNDKIGGKRARTTLKEIGE